MSNLFRDENQAKLFNQARAGSEDALSEFIHCNEGLVARVVARFNCKCLEHSDLMQEGLIGLLDAIHGFDTSRDIKFSTYAWRIIKQHVARAIQMNDGTIRIPREVRSAYSKISKKIKLTNDQYGRELVDDELISFGILSSEEMQLKNQYERLINVASIDAPLSNPVGNSDIALAEMIPSDAPAADSEIERKLRDEKLFKALGALPADQRQLLIVRYGLFGSNVHSLKAIGVCHRVSKQCINQREKKALKCLADSDELKGYCENNAE